MEPLQFLLTSLKFFQASFSLKLRYFEKATKLKNVLLFLKLLSNVKHRGRFFPNFCGLLKICTCLSRQTLKQRCKKFWNNFWPNFVISLKIYTKPTFKMTSFILMLSQWGCREDSQTRCGTGAPLKWHVCPVWQYRLWSFQTGGTKLERFLPKKQHTQRKLLNFENWVNGEVSKIGHHFSK